MTIMRQSFQIAVLIKSPFIFADVDASGIGIDTPALRNANNLPLLPADHFKGLLRQAFEALPLAATVGFTVEALFGPAPRQMTAYTPVRGSLHFADLVCSETYDRGDVTRIGIDDDTGTVEDGMLQVVELAVPLGAVVAFKGSLIWHGTSAEAVKLQGVLQKALRVIPYFGGLRSVGFGQHMRGLSIVGTPEASDLDISFKAVPGARYAVTARFDRPIAVNVKQLSDNIFAGSPVVPGSAIKGALAEMIKAGHPTMTPAQDAALAALKISHGFALAPDGTRLHRALPLSFCWFKKAGKFRNELGRAADEQGLFGNPHELGDFLPDMKEEAKDRLRVLTGRPDKVSQDREMQVWSLGHTQISATTGAAEDENLFVVLALDTSGLQYRFEVELPSDGQDYSWLLSRLKGGLDRIGKTEARLVDMTFAKLTDDTAILARERTEINILLETPALFIIPVDGDDAVPAENRLKQYFAEFGLTLIDYFCRRSLVGGYPVLRDKTRTSYRPFALYEAGSCFRLSGSPKAISGFLTKASRGLPVFREDPGGSLVLEQDWRRTVYLPENGYGELSLDPSFLVQP